MTDGGGCVFMAHAIAYEVEPGHNGISGTSLSTWLASLRYTPGQTFNDGAQTCVNGSCTVQWLVAASDPLTGSVGNEIKFTAGNALAPPQGFTVGPGGDIEATSLTTFNPIAGYVQYLTYAGSGTPSAACSAFVNNGAIAINATPVAYQCSNATGSYVWSQLGSTGAIGSFVSCATWSSGGSATWTPASAIGACTLAATHGQTFTLNVSGLTNGGFYRMLFTQDATGGGTTTLDLGTGCTWYVNNSIDYATASSVTITSNANNKDEMDFSYDGTNCVASYH